MPVNTVPACIAMAMVGERLFGLKGVSILVPLTAICRAPAQDGGLGQRESYYSLRTVSSKGT